MTDRQERRCGSCTACCTIMRVPDLGPGGKDCGVRCGHLSSRGCRIYPDRPQSCRDFACLWKQGALPEDMRPDKMGAVPTVGIYQGRQMIFLHADPQRPRHWRRFLDYWQRVAKRGSPVAIGINDVATWVIQAGSGEVVEKETGDA